METYVSKFSNEYSDLFALEGLKRGLKSILPVYKNPLDEEARSNMYK